MKRKSILKGMGLLIIIGDVILSLCVGSTPEEQNPVIEYSGEKELSRTVCDSLIVLGEDGTLDITEKSFINRLAELPEEFQRYVVESSVLNDKTIDTKELERLPSKEIVETNPEFAAWLLQQYYPQPQCAITPKDAMTIHENAWNTVIDRAQTDKYYRYGIYVSRTLAVRHPDVYLQSDGFFTAIITTNRGFKGAYDIKNVHSDELYERTFETPPFSFDLVDFQKYTIIESKEHYPEAYPFLPFLDRRVLPIASTLKSKGNTITQLELGVQQYFAQKEKSEKELYLIYCDNENTYLAVGEGIVSMETLGPVDTIEGNPILIFNENHVWYPLMKRDDTEESELLEELVTTYTTEVITPSLTEFEQQMIDELNQVTALSSELKRSMAVVFSMRPVQLGREMIQVRSSGSKAMYAEAYDTLVDNEIDIYAERRSFLKHGNYLSPITAYLAAVAETCEGEEKVIELSKEYLVYSAASNYSATPDLWWFQAHGHTWYCMFVEQTIDESYTTKAGHCIVQAANLSAVLDMGGIDNYWIQRLSKGGRSGHDWVCLPTYGNIVNNGAYWPKEIFRLNEISIDFIAQKDKWVYIREEWTGTATPEELIAMLEGLDEFYEVEISISTGLTLEEFIDVLKEEQ